MIVIDQRNEWLASRLVRADSDRMFAGVLAGNNPGHVWVDSIDSILSSMKLSVAVRFLKVFSMSTNRNWIQ